MATACLVCDAPIVTDGDVEKGEIVDCSSCGQEHEVTDVSPSGVTVGLAPEAEEDWGE